MQLVCDRPDIETNIESEEIGFSIDTDSAVIFTVLRERMYSDVLGSCIREVCDNARDAHREAGKQDTPIQITLPGEYLVIKDFGLGMSPDKIRNVYAVYGRSTKRADNTQGGGFGLGAKLPFALVDQFTVVTHSDGIRYEYVMYIDETNKGAIRLMGQTQSDEVGTEIRIPIPYNMKYSIKNEVERWTRYYSVSGDAMPHIRGNIVQFDPVTIIERGQNWVKIDNHSHVIVNGIGYSYHRNFHGICPCFDVGVIELASNRESIMVNDRNDKLIDDAIQSYKEYVIDKLTNSIDTMEFNDVIDALSAHSSFFPNKKNWVWRGINFEYPGSFNSFNKWSNKWFSNDTQHLYKNVVVLTGDEYATDFEKMLLRAKKHFSFNNKRVFTIVNGDTFPYKGLSSDDIKLAANRGGGGGGRIAGTVKWGHEIVDLDRAEGNLIYSSKDEFNQFKWKADLLGILFKSVADGNIKRVEKVPGWIHISDAINIIDKSLDVVAMQEFIDDNAKQAPYPLNMLSDETQKLLGYLDFSEKYAIKNSVITKGELSGFTLEKISDLVTYFNLTPNNFTFDSKKFPLMKCFSHSAYSEHKKEIEAYIKECVK